MLRVEKGYKFVGLNQLIMPRDEDESLIEAAKRGDLDEMERLIENGADVNAKDEFGRTPLHIAADNGHLSVVKFLVEHGADVNVRNAHGWTPLHYAAYFGRLDVVRFLVENGADVNAKNKYGQTPLDVASPEVRRALEDLIKRVRGRAGQQGVLMGGRLILGEVIGEGGFATVYRGRYEGSDVAVKVYRDVSKDFVNEIAVWLNLNHPNIVRIIGYDVKPKPYIIMELMDGNLRGVKLTLGEAASIFLGLVDALMHAHSRGVIHGDIKPENILIKREVGGRVIAKLTDWNASRIMTQHPTVSSSILITPTYAAPEQFDGVMEEATDVYQLCEVLYEVLTGTPPFPNVESKFKGVLRLPSVVDPALKVVDSLMVRCLSVDPRVRLSLGELRDWLAGVVGEGKPTVKS